MDTSQQVVGDGRFHEDLTLSLRQSLTKAWSYCDKGFVEKWQRFRQEILSWDTDGRVFCDAYRLSEK